MRPALSSTSAPNELMRRCLLRWQSERHSPALRLPCRRLPGFSFNPRFLRVLASDYSQRRYGSGVRNFSDVPGKPLGFGLASTLETSRAEGALGSAAETIPDLERQIAAKENESSVLLGRNPGPIPRGPSLFAQPVVPAVPAGLPSALL